MSIQDAELILSDDQALVATADSTNTIDLGAGIDHLNSAIVLNAGESMRHQFLNVLVTTSFAAATSYQFALQDSADDSSFAATEIITPAIVIATLIAGYVVLRTPIPSNIRRYIKMVYTEAGSTENAGTVSAWIGPAGQGPGESAALNP